MSTEDKRANESTSDGQRPGDEPVTVPNPMLRLLARGRGGVLPMIVTTTKNENGKPFYSGGATSSAFGEFPKPEKT